MKKRDKLFKLVEIVLILSIGVWFIQFDMIVMEFFIQGNHVKGQTINPIDLSFVGYLFIFLGIIKIKEVIQ